MGEFFEPNLQAAMIESRSEDCQPLQSAILVALIPVRRWLSFLRFARLIGERGDV